LEVSLAKFTKFNEQILQAGINLTTTRLKIVLVDMNDAGPTAGAWVITDVSEVVNPTITTNAAHGLAVGNRVEIFGVGGADEVNDVWYVDTVPTTTTFTITLATPPSTYISGGYVANLNTEFLSGFVGVGGRIGTSIPLSSVTVTNGVFDCADLTGVNKITTADGADPVEAFLLVRTAVLSGDTDLADSAQRLVYIGTPNGQGASGLPLTPNSGGVEMAFTNGIFALN
jgi:hypothetical protein